MNILRIYTWDYLRRNRHTACSIMIAILLVTTMLSALCGICVTTWSDNVRLTLAENGNWHGELFDTTFGRDLALIENYASVESTLIKGPWEAALLDSADKKRPYLISRDANAEYWASMAEKNLITRGRIPQKSGELALSKQYFDQHPETQIGDVWTLPLGNRIVN
ncbi:MAG: ABC transporter permease, partial [Butyricicoccus sp.]